MFEALSERLAAALKKISGRGVLRPEDVDAGLREVRLALLEADVNFKVVKEFIARVEERALGADVLQALNPAQQVIKVVHEELIEILGGEARRLRFAKVPPTVIMLAGLQGSGKTTTAVKLALLARRDGHRPLVVALDFRRPAAVEQLRALAARQRALADQLARLQAEGASAAAGALAQEARELARQLEAGRLDPQTIQRQERLYRRLLDAGRTLSGREPDENKERTSRPATGDSVHLPDVLKPGATGTGPRLRYPTWEELMNLTPEERRLVLEYFRRLNAPQQP